MKIARANTVNSLLKPDSKTKPNRVFPIKGKFVVAQVVGFELDAIPQCYLFHMQQVRGESALILAGVRVGVFLECSVFGSLDYFVLEFCGEVDEIVAISGDSNEQVSMFFWVFLCFAQRFCVHDVELDVMPIKFEVRADKVGEFVLSRFVC
jgi:hypothetical protein